MKKKYSVSPYKRWHDSRTKKISRRKKRDKKYNPDKGTSPIYGKSASEVVTRNPLVPPSNLSIIHNSVQCLIFFKRLRAQRWVNKQGNYLFVILDLRNVSYVDFSTICILIAIIGELAQRKIYIRGNFPKNSEAKTVIEESGLLNLMRDTEGEKFPVSEKSELLFIEKGAKKLTKEDNIRISKMVKSTVKHLTGEENHCKQLRTILLEICGNSIEWGGTVNKQWLIGIKYDSERVIFTITDVGKGILNTLNRKFKHVLSDLIYSDVEILQNAFVKKYGSSTQEINRNKGLPAIKKGFDDGLLKDLKVLTNNVILHFDNDKKSLSFIKQRGFDGTLYRWSITKESLETNFRTSA